MRAIITLWILLSAAWAGPKLVVLEAIGPDRTPAAQLMHWTDTVRGVVRTHAPSDLVVLTRENIEAFLPPGVDLADCEGECEISTGRKIGAEYVVGVRVVQSAEAWKLTVALHATVDGRFLGQGQVSVPHTRLDAGLREAALQAIKVLVATPAPDDPAVATTTPIEVPVAPITWMGAPIVRLTSDMNVPLTIHADGRRVGTTPVNLLLNGRKAVTVTATAPEHQTRTFRIRTGGASAEASLSLPNALASINLNVPFDNVTVHLNGRLLEGRYHAVEAGQYRIEVRHQCLKAQPIEVTLAVASEAALDVPYTLTCGKYRIESPTPGARVLMNAVWHPLPYESALEAPIATHAVIRAPGHRDHVAEVSAAPTGTRVYTFPLALDPVPVRVDVTRWNGESCQVPVVVDGTEVGRSPWTGTLLSGQHTITAQCDGKLTRTTTLRSDAGQVSFRLAKEGPRSEVVVSSTRLNSVLVTARQWTDTHRAGAVRAGIGFAVGGFGFRGRPAGGVGLEVGFGVPVTDWMELGGTATGLFGLRSCTAAEKAEKTEEDSEGCGHVYGEARAVIRFYLHGLVLEGGWGVTGQSYQDDRLGGSGLHLGIGGALE